MSTVTLSAGQQAAADYIAAGEFDMHCYPFFLGWFTHMVNLNPCLTPAELKAYRAEQWVAFQDYLIDKVKF